MGSDDWSFQFTTNLNLNEEVSLHVEATSYSGGTIERIIRCRWKTR